MGARHAWFSRRTLVCAGIVLALLFLIPPSDYRNYANAARAWVAGASRLYDPAAPQFFYAPWSLLLVLPLSALPDHIGQALFNLLGLGAAFLSLQVLAPGALARPSGRRALVFVLLTPFTFTLLVTGQWDAWVLAGAALAWHAARERRAFLWGIGLLLVVTKPTNAWVPLLLLLSMLRAWRPAQIARAFVLPVCAVLGSFLACGLDWPARYVAYRLAEPIWGRNVSLWQAQPWLAGAACLLLLAWLLRTLYRSGVAPESLALGMVASLAISTYVMPYHYVMLAPVLLLTGSRRPQAGWLLLGLQWLAFTAYYTGWSVLPLALCPLVIGCAFCYVSRDRNWRLETGD